MSDPRIEGLRDWLGSAEASYVGSMDGDTLDALAERIVTHHMGLGSHVESKPRFRSDASGRNWCEDCGCMISDRADHRRFHSILDSHAAAIARHVRDKAIAEAARQSTLRQVDDLRRVITGRASVAGEAHTPG